jgi:Protein of unknown function (DUF3551)
MTMNSTTMHRLGVAAAVMAAVAFAAGAAQAREGRWCAESPVGDGFVMRDCSFMTLQACVPYVIAGNRGFCNPNPRYAGPPFDAHRAHRKHRIKRP